MSSSPLSRETKRQLYPWRLVTFILAVDLAWTRADAHQWLSVGFVGFIALMAAFALWRDRGNA